MTKESQNIEFKESWRDEYLKMTVTLENGGSGNHSEIIIALQKNRE